MKPDIDAFLFGLSQVAKRGPIPAVGSGPNSVGKTLQYALGISHSKFNKNNYCGFTFTATKRALGGRARSNLFSRAPNWGYSEIKSRKEFFETVSSNSNVHEGKLYCTVDALKPNAYGLILDILEDKYSFQAFRTGESTKIITELLTFPDHSVRSLVSWPLSDILHLLQAKANNFALVQAHQLNDNEQSLFQFRNVEICSNLVIDEFSTILLDGGITLDHLLSINANGSVLEKGPMFKIRNDCRARLYTDWMLVDLLDL